MGRPALAQARATPVPPAKAHLQSLCSWDLKAVHKLQKLLMKSRSARLLAVRRVTQENQGKKTAGIDGVKSVPPTGRLALAQAIHPKRMSKRKPKSLRRVWIPKPGKAEQRPLGI